MGDEKVVMMLLLPGGGGGGDNCIGVVMVNCRGHVAKR